uniref:PAT complex subunit CCDC47 n=1 Tax=Culicoides sonorensis TaxID=179676 RepID=A0A336M334_CULSO
MKILVIFLAICAITIPRITCVEMEEDNDFADFEEFDDDEPVETGNSHQQSNSNRQQQSTGGGSKKQEDSFDDDDDDDGIVESEDSELFEGFDDEEFEGFNSETDTETENEIPKSADSGKKGGEPKITAAKVPIHFRTHWDSYWIEMLMLVGLFAYFSNYIVGRSRNSKIANMWLSTHRSLLEENFVLVGDDGRKEGEPFSGYVKESESLYTLWCSGRTCCEGMLVELKMIKRQDLVSLIAGLMRPVQDQVQIKVEISKDSMDTFVLCVASKKTATKSFKEINDLSKFCTLVNKPEDKYNVPQGFSVLSEIPEATAAMLDSKLLAALNKFGHLIDFIHISDQYSGVIQQEDPGQLKQPEVERVLIANFNIPPKTDMETLKPMLILVFYIMERLKRFRMSREAKNKADKNRARVEEQFLKTTHAARAEAAALRREEKRKAEKEKILAEEDPDKQKKWEKKEAKREKRKNQPKMKQLSIKAL